VSEFICSFCSRPMREARKLIAGPAVFICSECVELCCHVLVEEKDKGDPKPQLLGEQTSAFAKMSADLYEATKRARVLEHAMRSIAREVAGAIPAPHQINCSWCGLLLADTDAAREHVATCDKHPAVIRLRELEVSTPKRRRKS